MNNRWGKHVVKPHPFPGLGLVTFGSESSRFVSLIQSEKISSSGNWTVFQEKLLCPLA